MKLSILTFLILHCYLCIAQQSKPRTSPKSAKKIQDLRFTTALEQPPSADSLVIHTSSSGMVLSDTIPEQVGGIWFEQPPEFPGGYKSLTKFISNNLVYPEAAQKANIQGVVFVTFVVSSDGTIHTILVAKGLGYGCDEEALRVIKLMPKWKPGRQNGRTVDVRYTLPVRFAKSLKNEA